MFHYNVRLRGGGSAYWSQDGLESIEEVLAKADDGAKERVSEMVKEKNA